MSRPDVRFLDDSARESDLESRSAALQRAVHPLSTRELTAAYEAAWDEWTAAREDAAWAPITGDGLRT